MRCIILDLEATGLNPGKGDVIIDVAAVRVGPEGIEERYQSLVHLGNGTLSPFIEAMTGISKEMLQDAPPLKDVLPDLAAFVGDELPVVGHNISFDANFLKLSGMQIAPDRLVDTCDFATIYFPKAPSHSLEVLSTYLGLEHTEKHRAMGDVLATYELLRCLIAARDTAPEHMQAAAKTVVEKAATWAGAKFFALEAPHRDAKLEDVVPLRDANLSAGVTEGIASYQLRPSVRRTTQWALAQGNPAVLVGPADAESFRDLVLTEEAGIYLDAVENFLDPALAEAFLAQETWAPEQALFGLRLLCLAPRGVFVHQNTLAISHQERSVFAAFAAQEGALPAILSDDSKPLFITYTAWHKYKHYLPQQRLWVIPDAMRFEVNLHQTSKAYFSLDALAGRLKGLAMRCDEAGIKATDLHESLDHVVRYAFNGLSKLLRSDQRELILEEVPELMTQFALTWKKGLAQWQERLQEHASLLKQCQLLESMVDDFIAGMLDMNKRTLVSRMHQGILLQQERRSLQEEYKWFSEVTACHLLVGYTDSRFPAFLEIKETTVIDTLDLADCTFYHGRSNQIAEDFAVAPVSVAQAVMGQGAKHILFCTGSGAALDKAFDQLFDQLHGADFTVLSSGKTGGRGKVRYNFMHNDGTLLVATPQDAKGLGVCADTAIISVLPFPPVMGKYWIDAYGDNTFGTLTMPLMIQQIVDLAWAAKDKELALYITDVRFFEKQYGQEVMQTLSKLMKVA